MDDAAVIALASEHTDESDEPLAGAVLHPLVAVPFGDA